MQEFELGFERVSENFVRSGTHGRDNDDAGVTLGQVGVV